MTRAFPACGGFGRCGSGAPFAAMGAARLTAAGTVR